jgi:hypothetical protein
MSSTIIRVCACVLQVLVELPYVALQTLLYSGITYLLVGFELAAAKFFWYLLFTFLTLLFFTYYGEAAHSLRGDASACHAASRQDSLIISDPYIAC